MVKNVKAVNFLYILAFALACIRGLFELFFGKQVAFLLQFGGIVICLGLLINYKYVLNLLITKLLGLSIVVLIFISMLSILTTVLINGYFGANYFVVILFTVLLILFSFSANHDNLINHKLAFRAALIICFCLTLVALTQQFRSEIVVFPGATADFGLIRPQSITGSFLHYPLIIAIITCVTFVEVNKKVSFFSVSIFIYFFILLIFTLSRSGMFIVFFVIIYYIITKFNIKTILFVFILFVSVLFLKLVFPEEIEIISNRIFGSTSLNSEGNDARFELWKIGIGMLSPISLVSGTFFGLVTNSAPDGYSKGVVESGLLQQFLNIGIIATGFYYFALLRIKKILASEYFIILVACLLQTLIYQSIEVIPFLFLLITLPVYTSKSA